VTKYFEIGDKICPSACQDPRPEPEPLVPPIPALSLANGPMTGYLRAEGFGDLALDYETGYVNPGTGGAAPSIVNYQTAWVRGFGGFRTVDSCNAREQPTRFMATKMSYTGTAPIGQTTGIFFRTPYLDCPATMPVSIGQSYAVKTGGYLAIGGGTRLDTSSQQSHFGWAYRPLVTSGLTTCHGVRVYEFAGIYGDGPTRETFGGRGNDYETWVVNADGTLSPELTGDGLVNTNLPNMVLTWVNDETHVCG
jgi:hypothetical protein